MKFLYNITFKKVINIICLFISFISSVLSQEEPEKEIEIDTQPEVYFPEDNENTTIVPEQYTNCLTNEMTRGNCFPYVLCQIYNSTLQIVNECAMNTTDPINTIGLCCPIEEQMRLPSFRQEEIITYTKFIETKYKNILPPIDKRKPQIHPPNVKSVLKKAIEEAQEKFLDEEDKLARIIEESETVEDESAEGWFSRFHKIPQEILQDIEKENRMANMDILVTTIVKKKFKMLKGTGLKANVTDISLVGLNYRTGYEGKGDCRYDNDIVECNKNTKRRSYDGSCNNLINPSWGKSPSTYQRLLDPAYEDGVNTLRVQKDWAELPSARVVSGLYSENRAQELEDTEHTLAFVQFGQFLDHDLTSTPLGSTNGVKCCTKTGKIQAKENTHKNCIAIEIHKNDAFFAKFGRLCHHMIRSAPATRTNCKLGPREQLNLATSYIDGSQIYGTNKKIARRLREGKGGRLRIASKEIERRVNNSEGFLPPEDTSCEDIPPKCRFDAGDNRANENMQLAILHTIFLREHNRLAEALEKLNPDWGDDSIYHEARRIVIAELQHITYNEFLPILLGSTYMKHHQLLPERKGKFTALYDNEMDATILNVFATAAFRFGHTLIPFDISLADKEGNLTHYINLRRSFFNPAGLFRHFDEFLLGMTKQICRKYDQYLVPDLTQRLFDNTQGFGLDLMAINIQRGRDHGLPPYDEYFKLCGGEPVETWDALRKHLKPEAVDLLSGIYPVPAEIDLYVGGLAEKPEGDAFLGRTFVCLIGNQFIRLRKGDRYFYEEKTGGFRKAQLNQLRKVSLARIMCDNSKGIKKIQPLVMREFRKTNKVVKCSSTSIPKLDLKHWKVINNPES